jgi:hypothetical protein
MKLLVKKQLQLRFAINEARNFSRKDRLQRSTNLSQINRLRSVTSMKSTWCPCIGRDTRRVVEINGIVEQSTLWSNAPSVYLRYEMVDAVTEEGGQNGGGSSVKRKKKVGHHYFDYTNALVAVVVGHASRLKEWSDRLHRFTIVVPSASAPRAKLHIGYLKPWIVSYIILKRI